MALKIIIFIRTLTWKDVRMPSFITLPLQINRLRKKVFFLNSLYWELVRVRLGSGLFSLKFPRYQISVKRNLYYLLVPPKRLGLLLLFAATSCRVLYKTFCILFYDICILYLECISSLPLDRKK